MRRIKGLLHKKTNIKKIKVHVARPEAHYSVGHLLIFAIIFGCIGAYIVLRSFAATTPVALLEAENMVLPTGASIISDTSASNSQATRLTTNGTATGQATLNTPATQLTIRAKGIQCGGAPQMIVKIDNVQVYSTSVSSTSWTDYTVTTSATSGVHTASISFTNDYTQYKKGNNRFQCTRDLFVDKVTWLGEASVTPPPPAPACSDTIDNDSDTKVDYPADPGCSSNSDTDEVDVVVTQPSQDSGGGVTYACSKTLVAGGDVQSFVDSLTAGQTGCIPGGTYNVSSLKFSKADVTVASSPGARATINLTSEAAVPDSGDNVTIRRINFRTSDNHVIRVFGENVILEDNDFTNNGNATSGACVGVGGSGGDAYLAYNLIIRRNIFKDCGGNSTNQNHAIYAAHFKTLTVTDNLFYGNGAYRLQLYPEADGATVTHNIFDSSGASRGGVVISTETQYSRNHIVERNIIVNSPIVGISVNNAKPNITNNQANYNCFYNNSGGNISGTLSQTGNITANPLFVSSGTGDYRLQTNSGCLSLVQYDTYAKILANR